MTETQGTKPLPIIVGVQGFVATRTPVDEVPVRLIDWPRVRDLPAFQMFVAERGGDVRQAQDFFDAYCAWHEAKGYWPKETPLGKLKE